MLFCFAFSLSWIICICIGAKYAGWTVTPLLTLHPSSQFGCEVALGRRSLIWWIGFFLLLALLTASFLSGIAEKICGIALLIIYGPLPLFVIDAMRRDLRLRSREVIFYSPIASPGTRFRREIIDGQTKDVAEPVVVYISDNDWKDLSTSGPEVKNFFESEYRIGPNLYRARGNGDFLRSFDSLGLWRFLVHPGNNGAIDAFAAALRKEKAPAVTKEELSNPLLSSELATQINKVTPAKNTKGPKSSVAPVFAATSSVKIANSKYPENLARGDDQSSAPSILSSPPLDLPAVKNMESWDERSTKTPAVIVSDSPEIDDFALPIITQFSQASKSEVPNVTAIAVAPVIRSSIPAEDLESWEVEENPKPAPPSLISSSKNFTEDHQEMTPPKDLFLPRRRLKPKKNKPIPRDATPNVPPPV